MKSYIIPICLFFITSSYSAQQLSIGELSRNAKFIKSIDELNNGKTKIKYTDIKGSPFYKKEFSQARAEESQVIFGARYNSFLDTIEIQSGLDIYEVDKEKPLKNIYFIYTNENLISVPNSGYFFEVVKGKYKLLRKEKTEFFPETPSNNPIIPSTPARFDALKPTYYILTESGDLVKIGKEESIIVNSLDADKREGVKSFIKSNKIKLHKEEDLKKLVTFLNQ